MYGLWKLEEKKNGVVDRYLSNHHDDDKHVHKVQMGLEIRGQGRDREAAAADDEEGVLLDFQIRM